MQTQEENIKTFFFLDYASLDLTRVFVKIMYNKCLFGSLRWLNFIIDRFSLKRTYIFIKTSSTHIWNFKQIVYLWSEIWGFKISILAMLKNAKIFDKMLIFFKSTLYTLIKILQNLKRINAVKYMQW